MPVHSLTIRLLIALKHFFDTIVRKHAFGTDYPYLAYTQNVQGLRSHRRTADDARWGLKMILRKMAFAILSIICLQEVHEDDIALVTKFANDHGYGFIQTETDAVQHKVCITLWSETQFTLVRSKVHSKCILTILTAIHDGDRRFYVVNGHLSARGPKTTSETRCLELRKALHAVEHEIRTFPGSVVVLGDFNDTPGSLLDNFINGQMPSTSVLKTLKPVDFERTRLIGLRSLHTADSPPTHYNLARFGAILDHVYLSQPPDSAILRYMPYDPSVSDHAGLWAGFS